MTLVLETDFWKDLDRYSLDDLNRVIQSYANNDNRLKDIVDSLMLLYSTDPGVFPIGSILKTPDDLKTIIDDIIGLDSTDTRVRVLLPPEDPRSISEIYRVFAEEPFASLIAGAKLKPAEQLKLLNIFQLIRGMVYWAKDIPPYTAEPELISQGGFFWTTISRVRDDVTEYLLVDERGIPLIVNDLQVFKPLPDAHSDAILVLEYQLRAILADKLRTMYRISNFEAGIDSNFSSKDSEFGRQFSSVNIDTSPSPCSPLSPSPFGSPPGSPSFASCLDLPRRMPVGFTELGAFRFLRESAGDFAHEIDMNRFVPDKVNHRLLMEESLIQTPFGLFRIPFCEINWEAQVPEFDFNNPELGDPLIVVGLQCSIQLVKRDADQKDPIGFPATVEGTGFIEGIELLQKDEILPYDNVPGEHGFGDIKDLIAPGHGHGQVQGFIQTDDLVSPATTVPQFPQIQIKPVIYPIRGQTLRDFLADPEATLFRDEIRLVNRRSTSIDDSPEVTQGFTGRNILQFLREQGLVDEWEYDNEQICLVRLIDSRDPNLPRVRKWEAFLPLGVQLIKNPNPFNFSRLNGSDAEFKDGFAIRRISSVQAQNETIILDDENGDPEDFSITFVNTDATVYTKDGRVVPVNIVEKLDKLAFLTKGSAAQIKAGDVIIFDQREPDGSLNSVFRNEVNFRSWIDLRTHSARLIDSIVRESTQGSPEEGFELEKIFNRDLLDAVVGSTYENMRVATESMMRFHQVQRFFSKASDKHEVTDLRIPADKLKGFLIDFVKNFEENRKHPYAIGENILITWPDQEPELEVPLDRYQRRKILANKDRLVLKEVGELGVVPVLIKHLDAQEHVRFPTRQDTTLTFVSERNFAISGHTKLSGTFFLDPEDTQIFDPTLKITLEHQRVVSEGVTSLEFLGSVELKHERATSFENAEGVFAIDGTARYDPRTRRLNIPYNQTVNFSTEEPGILTVAASFHDLADIHPIFRWEPQVYALQLSHLSDARGFKIEGGEGVPFDTITRLEGISFNGGEVWIRFDKEDAFKIVEQRGFVETDWVVRGLPWIIIKSVEFDDAGDPIDLEFDAFIIDQNQTIVTSIENEVRNKQVYIPCDQKYGWVDVGQSNMHTQELAPQATASARFGFYQVTNFKAPDGALEFETIFRSLLFTLKIEPLDYRFTTEYTVGDFDSFKYIASLGVFSNPNTGERKGIIGLFKEAQDRGNKVELNEELDFSNFEDQEEPIYFKDDEVGEDWIPDFIGVLITVRDSESIDLSADSKMAAIGYWYNGHDALERLRTIVKFGADSFGIQTQTIPKDNTRFRIGDLPNRYLYRQNTLLEADRTKADPIPVSPTPTSP